MYVKTYDREWIVDTPRERNPQRYGMLRSVSFNPEIDITLSSLPVCEFSVEIIITDGREIKKGQYIQLYDDKDTMYADYRIAKVEQIAEQVVRVLAQSDLALMDSWVLESCRVTNNVSISRWIYLFTHYDVYVKSGKQQKVPISYFDDTREITLDGFFPKQTMRERLQQICFAYGITVQQWFCSGIVLTRCTEIGQIPLPGDLIPANDTYMYPQRQYLDPAGSFVAVNYHSWTTEKPIGSPPEEIEDDDGVTWYYYSGPNEVKNDENDAGSVVTISDVMIINPDNLQEVLWRSWRNFVAEEYIVDVINNGQYYPNLPVKFYYDTDGNLSNAIIIDGIITKCDFTFGTQNRAKLTIARIPDTTPQTVHCTTVHYVYEYTVDDGDGGTTEKTLALGRNEYYVPAGAMVSFDTPTIYIDVVGDTLAFVVDRDDTRNIYGCVVGDHDTEETLYYKRKEAS